MKPLPISVALTLLLVSACGSLLGAELGAELSAELGAELGAEPRAEPARGRVVAGPPATPKSTVALRSLPVSVAAESWVEKANDRINPRAGEPDRGRRGTWNRGALPEDPLAAMGRVSEHRTPSPLLTFAGTGNPVGCGGCSPPDTVGDVGPHQYVQMVNATKIAVFDKSGALLVGPVNLSTLFTSGGCTSNSGDPVVVYDPLADRWVLAQFASPRNLCFAVSQSADPGGAYFVYDFQTDQFPDYFKIGVWPDGYYVSTNESDYNAWVVERVPMLAGQTARSQKGAAPAANLLLPADVDGLTAPPAGAPGLFYTFLDGDYHGGADRLELWELDVDWETPANSTFVSVASPALAPFVYTVCGFFDFNCARQPGTTQRLDTVSEWPMHRLAYRNFGAHRALVGSFAVGGGMVGGPRNKPNNAGAIVRWFELREAGSGWSLFQEGTHDPVDTEDRFMSSIAQDALGNAALGYSVSSKAVSPSIRYATRLASDTPGTFGTEATLFAGAGSQTASNRWGDYSALSIDPADDCTFWYTSEYYAATSSSTWSTRIGAFRIPECTGLFLDNFETGGVTRWSSAAP